MSLQTLGELHEATYTPEVASDPQITTIRAAIRLQMAQQAEEQVAGLTVFETISLHGEDQDAVDRSEPRRALMAAAQRRVESDLGMAVWTEEVLAERARAQGWNDLPAEEANRRWGLAWREEADRRMTSPNRVKTTAAEALIIADTQGSAIVGEAEYEDVMTARACAAFPAQLSCTPQDRAASSAERLRQAAVQARQDGAAFPVSPGGLAAGVRMSRARFESGYEDERYEDGFSFPCASAEATGMQVFDDLAERDEEIDAGTQAMVALAHWGRSEGLSDDEIIDAFGRSRGSARA